MIWFTRAVVLSFAGAVALIGVGLMRAARSVRKVRPDIGARNTARGRTSLADIGLGLFVIGLMGALVALAG